MTIEEARKLKQELQFNIYKLVQEFESVTKVTVEEIEIHRTPGYGCRVPHFAAIYIKTAGI
jgi:hypothetical protein